MRRSESKRQHKPLTVFDDLHQAAEVGQNGAAHEDGDLLHDLDARVPGLPGLLAFAHGFEKREEGGNAEGGGHHGERPGRGVPDVLVHVVDIGPHGGDHGGQTGGLGTDGKRSVKVKYTEVCKTGFRCSGIYSTVCMCLGVWPTGAG